MILSKAYHKTTEKSIQERAPKFLRSLISSDASTCERESSLVLLDLLSDFPVKVLGDVAFAPR